MPGAGGNIDPLLVSKFLKTEPRRMAQQMTMQQFIFFRRIHHSELLQQRWCKKSSRHLSPNVTNTINAFAQVTNAIGYMIVSQERTKKRIKIITHWIDIAQQLLKLNNFHGASSVVSGLKCVSVRRLKKTWQGLSKKSEKIWEDIHTDHSLLYRMRLFAAQPPCLPYLGIYLTDLTFLDIGPENIEKTINWQKCELTANVIKQMKKFQQQPYNLPLEEKVLALLNYFFSFGNVTESELYKLSLRAEGEQKDKNS
jgi:son of sevenless-like protein